MNEFDPDTEVYKESWVHNRWRPFVGYSYIVVSLFDFVIAPTLVGFGKTMFETFPYETWEPITLQGNGIYYLMTGAILGVTSYSRGQEKINGVAGVNKVVKK